MSGKVKIDPEVCKGCSYCVVACPVKIILISEKANNHGYHYAGVTEAAMVKCTGCRACAIVCPDIAIEVWKE